MWNLAEFGFQRFTAKSWCFLDTNCLSYLIKNFSDDSFKNRAYVLLRKLPPIVSGAQIMEIVKDDRLIDGFVATATALQARFIPSFRSILEAEVRQYWDPKSSDPFHVFSYVSNLKSQLASEEFFQACQKGEEETRDAYVNILSRVAGKVLDERDLIVEFTYQLINKFSLELFGREMPFPIVPSTFKSFFVFSYAYLYRYRKTESSKVEANDAIDITNTSVAPYCRRYYCERSFANTLMEFKGKQTPSAYHIVKRASKLKIINDHALQKIRAIKRKERTLNFQYTLLGNVQVYKYSDLVDQIDSMAQQ